MLLFREGFSFIIVCARRRPSIYAVILNLWVILLEFSPFRNPRLYYAIIIEIEREILHGFRNL